MTAPAAKRLTVQEIRARKGGRKLSMIAVNDFPMARLAEAAGIELILVGNSLGMTALGYESPVPVTVEEMLHHCKAVRRGAPNTHVVADLPFLSYHLSDAQALQNAGRMLQEGGADAVKLEGASAEMAERTRRLVQTGIPVMGHIGLTPQSGATLGFGGRGHDAASALALVEEAKALADAGVHMLIVEAVPVEVAALITATVPVPTIGIGSGPRCDGQTVVATDMLGIETNLFLNFARHFAEIGNEIGRAFAEYREEVETGVYPGPELAASLQADVVAELRKKVGQ